MMIATERDLAGIRVAAREMLEAALLSMMRKKAERLIRGAANEQELLAEYDGQFTLAEGYYTWVNYLFSLRRGLDDGTVLPQWLEADDVRGLYVVGEAREAFREAHPPCVHCGAALRAAGDNCWRCGKAQRQE
jgi:ribosomal protein S27AE